MKRRLLTSIFASLGLILLIVDSKTAVTSARDGIALCLQTVIPSLFPFFVLSVLLTGAVSGSKLRLLNPIGKLCGIPSGSEILLLTGFLGGYPVGAQAVAQAWRDGQLCKEDARRMLGFCSNAGPSFIFGILGVFFENPWIPAAIWAIHIISALTVGVILPGRSMSFASLKPGRAVGISEAVQRSVKIIAGVCAWVVMFRIIIAFIMGSVTGQISGALSVLICGVLELANGCCMLGTIGDTPMRFVVACGLLALGGLCVCMQTVTAVDKLGLGLYLPGKILQAVISILLAALASPLLFGNVTLSPAAIVPLIIAGGAVFLITKKSVAFQREMVYN